MFALLSFFLLAPSLPGSPLGGVWVTPDKSLVEVLPCAGGSNLCIRVVGFDANGAPKTDTKNPDASLRSRPLCGLPIGTGFAPNGEEATGGKLYDPESGHTYSGSMKLDGADTLKLRGFVGVSVLGRTEMWHRASGTVVGCDGVSRSAR